MNQNPVDVMRKKMLRMVFTPVSQRIFGSKMGGLIANVAIADGVLTLDDAQDPVVIDEAGNAIPYRTDREGACKALLTRYAEHAVPGAAANIGRPSMTRAEFNQLDPYQQSDFFVKQNGVLED